MKKKCWEAMYALLYKDQYQNTDKLSVKKHTMKVLRFMIFI